MIKKLYDKIEKEKYPSNKLKSQQIGNFCYMIAALELYYACPFFLKFLHFLKNLIL